MRSDGRAPDELRPVRMVRGYTRNPDGSVLIRQGDTVVLATALVENSVPPWMRGQGSGWVTATYEMLPGSTDRRKRRATQGRGPDGRGVEIKRLVGRSLRSVCDLAALGERQVHVDCDVLQADGGTRTAAITAAWVALADAVRGLAEQGVKPEQVLRHQVAAVSAGVVDGEVVLDLPYTEDVRAEVDLNLVMTDDGRFAEVQGTGEESTFSRTQLKKMLEMGEAGIGRLLEMQRACLDGPTGPEAGTEGADAPPPTPPGGAAS